MQFAPQTWSDMVFRTSSKIIAVQILDEASKLPRLNRHETVNDIDCRFSCGWVVGGGEE